jgi:hypothetical protein
MLTVREDKDTMFSENILQKMKDSIPGSTGIQSRLKKLSDDTFAV